MLEIHVRFLTLNLIHVMAGGQVSGRGAGCGFVIQKFDVPHKISVSLETHCFAQVILKVSP